MATTTTQEETTAAYRKRVLGFLGNQDPVQVLGRTADVLHGAGLEPGRVPCVRRQRTS